MFAKVLIANRGEIAVRIIRALQEMDIATVAVYSEADDDSLHVQLADEAYCIGPANALDSYLNIPSIMSVAELTGAEAIHPGYGFLAENGDFAEVCESHGVKFIGPAAEVISLMGDKARARKTMKEAGVPVVPGTEGGVKDVGEASQAADEIGYPVIVKASAGGGGKGMRIVNSRDELENAFQTASSEAGAAFGDETLYVEKFLEEPRHIEFQILADEQGNVVHLGERDCSIQWRHQKMIEEAPSHVLSSELRQKMGETAIRAATAVDYKNAGTVEFLYDGQDNFYFMEMNTRIQVEHPVTEMITGIDIVKEQIKIAAGKELEYEQEDINFSGAALECRVNAENPEKDFRPSPGKVEQYIVPGGFGVRIDSSVYPEYYINPFYDSMVAKLITRGENRREAIATMKRALKEFKIEGVKTTIPFYLQIMNDDDFASGNYTTKYINKHQFMNDK